MKLFFLFFAVLFNTVILAETRASYHILEGVIHKGGVASIETIYSISENFVVKINYQLYKRIWVPLPNDAFKGEEILTMPEEFKDERGYLELEVRQQMDIQNAKLKFLQRVKWPGMSDAYQILILPNNGKSKITLTYHPSLPAAGWSEIIVSLINPIKIIDGYQIFVELN
jgi:hypothetical protein